MDDRTEKAFAVANYMATLSNQRRIILEEFNQKLIYYKNGGTFKISTSLITFAKIMIDAGHTTDVQFIDENTFPILINDVEEFYDSITELYLQAVNEYAAKFADIKKKRKVEDIVSL